MVRVATADSEGRAGKKRERDASFWSLRLLHYNIIFRVFRRIALRFRIASLLCRPCHSSCHPCVLIGLSRLFADLGLGAYLWLGC